MTKRTSPPTPPATCRFCGQPAVERLGIVPVCAECAPVAKAARERLAEALMTVLREIEVRSGVENVEEQGAVA